MMRRPRRRSKSMDASLSLDSLGGSQHSHDSTCSFLTAKSHGSGLGRPPRKQKPPLKRAASSGFGLTAMRSMLGSSRNNHHSRQEEQKKLNELNIFCSDALVSTAFCLSRMELAQKNSSVVKLELEDMIDRKDQTLFLEVMDVMIADRRPWKWIRLSDHLYTEERYDRYLGLKQQLWRLVEDQAIKRHIPVQFQAIMEIARGSTTEYVVNFLQRLNDSSDLKSIEFAGAMFGFLPWRIPNELEQLCNKGYLRETVVLKLWYKNIATDAGNHAVALSLDCTGEGGDEEVAKSGAQLGDNSVQMGKARSVQVLAACIDLLRDMQVEVEGDEELRKGDNNNTGESSKSPRFRGRGNNQISENKKSKERPGLRRCGTTGQMSRRRLAIVKLTEQQQQEEEEVEEEEASRRRSSSGSIGSSSGRRRPRLRRSSTMPLRRRLSLVKPMADEAETPPPPKRVSDTSISESSTGTMDAFSSLEKLSSMREGFKAIRRRASMEMMGNSPDSQHYTTQNGSDNDPEPRRKSIRRSRSIGSAFRTRLHSPPPPPELDSSCDSDKSHPKSPGLMRSVRRRQPPRRHKSFDDTLKFGRSPVGTPRRLRRPSRVRKATSEGHRRSSGSHYSDDTASLDYSQPRRHSSNGSDKRMSLSTSNGSRFSLRNRRESMSWSECNSRRRRSSSRNRRESMSGSEGNSRRRGSSSSRNKRDSLSRFKAYSQRRRFSSRDRSEIRSVSEDSSRRTSTRKQSIVVDEDDVRAELEMTSEDEHDSDSAPALKDYSMKDQSSSSVVLRKHGTSEDLVDSRREMKVWAAEEEDTRISIDVKSDLHRDETDSGEVSAPTTSQSALQSSEPISGFSPEATQGNYEKIDDSSSQGNDEPELCCRIEPSPDLPLTAPQRYDENTSNDDSSSQAYDEPDLCWHIDNNSTFILPPKEPEPELEPELCWHVDNEPSSNLLANVGQASGLVENAGESPDVRCFDDNRSAASPAEAPQSAVLRDNLFQPMRVEAEQAKCCYGSPDSQLPAFSKSPKDDHTGPVYSNAATPNRNQHEALLFMDVKAEQLRDFADDQRSPPPPVSGIKEEGVEPVVKEAARPNQHDHKAPLLVNAEAERPNDSDDDLDLPLPAASELQKEEGDDDEEEEEEEEEAQSAHPKGNDQKASLLDENKKPVDFKQDPNVHVPVVFEPEKEDGNEPAAHTLASPPHPKKVGPSSPLAAPSLSRNHSDYLPSLLRSDTEEGDDDDASLILEAELNAASMHLDSSRSKTSHDGKQAQVEARGHSTDGTSLVRVANNSHNEIRTSNFHQRMNTSEIQSQRNGDAEGNLPTLLDASKGRLGSSIPMGVQSMSQGQNQQVEDSSSPPPGKPHPDDQSDDDSDSVGVLDEIMHNSIALMDIGMLHDIVSGPVHTENTKSIMELFGTDSKGPEYGLGSGGSVGSSSTLTMDGFCSISSVDTSRITSSKNGKKKKKKKNRSTSRGRGKDSHKSSSSLELSPKLGSQKKHRRDELSPSKIMAGPLAPHRFSKSMSTLGVAAADFELSDSDDNSAEDATAFTFDHAFTDQEPDFRWETNTYVTR